jgi:outer membrane protein insertion porin family
MNRVKITCVVFFMAMSSLLAMAATPCHAAEAVFVSKIEIVGLKTISEAVVRDVIGIKEGDLFSLREVDASVERLKKWGEFDNIEVSPEVFEDRVSLRYKLDEATVVESIDIYGNYPYIENKVRKYLNLHAGDIYTEDRVQEQTERIVDFYKKQGFVGTQVYASERYLPETNGMTVSIHIKRGEVLRYSSIKVEGNRAYPTGRFVSKINPLRPYSERRLKDAIRDLRDFYAKKGYTKAKIRIAKKEINFDAKRVDLELDVDEGPQVEVRFVGSPHTSRKLLRQNVTILDESSIDDFIIETNAADLEKFYRGRGYPNAKVHGKKEIAVGGKTVVTFFIDEGVAQKIRMLNLVGNKDVSKSSILKEMKNKNRSYADSGAYLPESVPDDDAAIKAAMAAKGYLNPTVRRWVVKPTRDGNALDIKIPIEAGGQTVLEDILFEGTGDELTRKLLKEIKAKEGKPFNLPGVDSDRERIFTYLADHGYPYARVTSGWKVSEDGKEATIIYNVKTGELVHIGRILITGDVLTSQKAIKHAMNIKEGDIFSYKKIMESQLNIRRLGPFVSVNMNTIGLEEGASVVHLRIKVEEQRPFLLDAGLNYSSYDRFTGSFTFSNINAFGWAKTNSLQLTGGQRLARAELAWKDPRFLGSSFEMMDNVWIEHKQRPAYSYVQTGGSLGWFRRYRRFGFLFRWGLSRNYFISGSTAAANKDSLRNATVSDTTLSASYDSRDNFADPRSGFYTIASGDVFNEIKGNEANFFTLSWSGESDLSPMRRVTFSTSLRFARILTVGRNVAVPPNELLFLGGDDTIRGFPEDSLGPKDAKGKATGGRLRWIVNEEMRIRLLKHFAIAGFFDMGSLTESFSQISWNSNVRRSAGGGLRYITPVGPIRLDYGFKLDRKPGEAKGKLHFTFGYVF